MHTEEWITVETAEELYGIKMNNIWVQMHGKKLPRKIFRKGGYLDIGYLKKQKEYRKMMKMKGQEAFYFLEEYMSTEEIGRIVTKLYGGKERNNSMYARVYLFTLPEESLSQTQFSENGFKFYRLYRKIQRMLKKYETSIEECLDARIDDDMDYKIIEDIVIKELLGDKVEFDKIDDYYGYYEAKRMLDELTRNNWQDRRNDNI